MDFFTEQDKARAKSSNLVFLFCLAVVSIIVSLFALLSLVGSQDKDLSKLSWSLELFIMVALGSLLVVGLASLIRFAFLSGGGKVVAESLGGKRLQPNTANPLETRILNLVEEMAIASGTPVPPVYLLEEDGINAFAAGYSPADAVVGITRGCAEKLNRDQLQGVIAHEFSHILNGDMRLNIRLSGIIFGIIFLSRIGEIMMRVSGSSRRRSSNNDNGGAALVMIGLGIFIIGLVGGFFGSLIRAAVSRQREFLADASAVQFTRNPEGISGALKRIGGFSSGSEIQSSLAGDYSHFFFSSALSSMFATHPPLPLRIRRIEPNWASEYPDTDKISEQVDGSTSQISGFAGTSGPTTGASPQPAPSPDAQNNSGPSTRDSFLKSFEGPQKKQIKHAQSLLQQISPALLSLAKEPTGCRCILFALLLDSKNSSVRDQQTQLILRDTDQDTTTLTQKIFPQIQELSCELKYLLIEESAPSFTLFSPAQMEDFLTLIDSLMQADQKIDLFEWSLQKVIGYQLSHQSNNSTKALHGRASLKSRINECSIFLGALAHFGGEPEQVVQSYKKGFRSLDRSRPVHLPPVEKCNDLGSMDAALLKLNKMTPLAKRSFLDACSKVAEHDGVISDTEIQIIRGIAAALSCPLGPVSASSS